MIDIRKIEENQLEIEKALGKRIPGIKLDEIVKTSMERRRLITSVSKLQEERNRVSKEIPNKKKNGENVDGLILRMREVGDEIAIRNSEVREIEEKLNDMLSALPNVPDDDVLAGGKENNEVLLTWGEQPKFDFQPKDHCTLAEELNMIDFKRGVKLAGQGSWIYKGVGAELEWALLNFFVDSHLKDSWEFTLVPHMLTYECGYTAGQFPKFQNEVYWLDGTYRKDGRFLLPTAETALVNLHRDEVLSEDELPKKYFGYTPCYRREAGSSRVEERGTVRGHQFNKVELIQYTKDDDSERAFEEMLAKAQKLIQDLGLHYQLSKLAAGDCSASMCRTYDIEVWIPSMGIYKEVSSVSNSRDYQARRGNMRYKEKGTGVIKYMHTLNASGLATSRLLPAILEQNQMQDGSILIPEVLRKYMGGKEKINANGDSQ